MTMRVYVASSWRNIRQPEVVGAIRAAGHQVYDFRNPSPGNTGFGWKQCMKESDLVRVGDSDLINPLAFRDRVLQHPVAQEAFAFDMDALRDAEATVLLLPCGRSAHLELGYACGAGQRTLVLLDNPMSEPELMYLMTTKICVTLVEVLEGLRS
jgi:hypothetical protein